MISRSVLIKPASGSCNMHCDYCYYCDEAHKRQQASYGIMSDQTLRNVIKRTLMRTDGTYTLAFQGGEPTLCGLPFYQKVISYTDKYNKNHAQVQFALQTNGYSIDKNWAQFLHDHHFLVGLSIDGREDIHNAYRHGKDGGNSYEHALRAAALFDQYQVDYNILTVVHRRVAENIKAIYAEYKERGWHYLQFIACLDPLGAAHGQQAYSLTPEVYGQFLIDLFECWYDDLQRREQPYIRQFDNYIGILLGVPPESCDQRGQCSLQCVVEADGSVYPCDFYVLDEYRLGNLNTDLLPQIEDAEAARTFIARSHSIPDDCRRCKWLSLCRNGCYRCRTGADHRNDYCKAYQMLFEAEYPRMQEIAALVKSQQ